MLALFEMGSVLLCSLLAGSLWYILIVEQSLRLRSPSHAALANYRALFDSASLFMLSLLAGAAFCALMAWVISWNQLWFIGLLILISNIPYTIKMVLPIHKTLTSEQLDPHSEIVILHLKRWGTLHRLRVMTSSIAAIIFTGIVTFQWHIG